MRIYFYGECRQNRCGDEPHQQFWRVLFESGACPNSLSIYQRLQSFYINCNKERNILIESKDENEYSVIIEAYSKDNILFKKN